jgi:hypothetical protein
LSDIAVYTVTLVSKLANYPTATPATAQFTLMIVHPCDLTVLQPFTIMPMSFTLGFVQTVTQIFPQFKDTVAESLVNSKFCGERIYTLIDGYSFLNLAVPLDPWNSNFQIELFSIDPTKVGQYSASLAVKFVSYPLPPPLVVTFSVTILPVPKNNLPYFEPKLTGSATIQKTKDPKSWTLKLPGTVDLDKELVTVTADFGSAASFLVLNGQTSIDCDDISAKTTFKAGMYLIKIMLNDGRDIVSYNFSIFVVDLPPEPVAPLPAPAKNETATTTETKA